MLYTLRSGRTLELTFEQWYGLTPEDEDVLVALGQGEEINNPWRGSILERPDRGDIDILIELPDIPIEVKLGDEELFVEE